MDSAKPPQPCEAASTARPLQANCPRIGRVSLPLRAAATLDRGTYGWMECVAAEPCRDREAVDRYYQRAGMLVCLVSSPNPKIRSRRPRIDARIAAMSRAAHSMAATDALASPEPRP